MAANKGSEQQITPRAVDYARWYQDVVSQAGLAETSDVRGCMVIRPYGFALWENIQRVMDGMFKETGVENAYFPLFIPMSYLSREAEHVEGFAKECAVVTHHRLKAVDGKLAPDPESLLEEPLVVRPTSETIINATFAKWVQSHRDLPLLINQWCNVVRWEMRTRLFLRTTEFLWQEGHTAHATPDEAQERALLMLRVYRRFVEEWMAIPVITGVKTASERFAGAVNTYTMEAMMQDKRALQAGTSHNLGDNFARAFGTQYQSEGGKLTYVHQTSWGVSTRLIGALVMAHGDDRGLVLPPNLAPVQAVILPLFRKEQEAAAVREKAQEFRQRLAARGTAAKVDDRDTLSAGARFFWWEKRGVPLRIEIGPRDLKENQFVLVRRDTGEKSFHPQAALEETVARALEEMQRGLFDRARAFRDANTVRVETWSDFADAFRDENSAFVMARWCGDPMVEAQIKEETKATIRCVPFDNPRDDGPCVKSGRPASERVLFSKAY
ncbi:MAG: proline--tRNA ligase [Planctomycetes bacterium]|nr:proline--tRNA ligase [Planctomycetota bacterium]